MTKQHLKRINVPKTWNLRKKEHVFVSRPNPGAHSMDTSIPLLIVIRDILKLARTKQEVVTLLHRKTVLVNLKQQKDHKFPIGIMDTLSFEDIDEHYRVIINHKGKLDLHTTSKERTQIRPVKICGKITLKKGLVQLNFTDGKNLIVKKDQYNVGDTLILEHPNKIKDHIKIEQGAYVYFTKGKQVGKSGVIVDVSQEKIIFRMKNGKNQETSKKYAFIIGKDKPAIVLPEE